MDIVYRQIGVIRSPFDDVEEMPIQPAGAKGVRGTVELFQDFVPGLQDLEGFSHLILLYHFHLVRETKLVVVPFLDTQPHGIFATRAPKRPNAIGLSVVELMHIDRGTLHIRDIDVINGTPLLDIKPWVPEFDVQREARIGWLEAAKDRISSTRSDDRFR